MGRNADMQKLQDEEAQIESQWAFKCNYLKVRQDTIKRVGHPHKIWEIAVMPGAVAILPIDSKGNLILIEQWRRAIGHITLEIPAGMIDPGEDPLACAQRELQEETGYKAGELTPWGGYYTSPGMISEYIHLFLAKNLTESRLYADDTEGIDHRKVTIPEALAMIAQGEICDAKTTIAILRYAK